MSDLIDNEGYRSNVGIIVSNRDNNLLWAHRIGVDAWQFPQGGIKINETPEQAMYRELLEEVGLGHQHIEILGFTKKWLSYRLPKRYMRKNHHPLCIGQKQIWFLLRFVGTDNDIHLNGSAKPEFDRWRWVDYWAPIGTIVAFKRKVYVAALHELAPLLFGQKNKIQS